MAHPQRALGLAGFVLAVGLILAIGTPALAGAQSDCRISLSDDVQVSVDEPLSQGDEFTASYEARAVLGKWEVDNRLAAEHGRIQGEVDDVELQQGEEAVITARFTVGDVPDGTYSVSLFSRAECQSGDERVSEIYSFEVTVRADAAEPETDPESVLRDFGDAPDRPFPTLERSDGVRHLPNRIMWLGEDVNYEPDGRVLDLDRHDDAAYRFFVDSNGQTRFETEVSAHDDAPSDAYLNVLVDYNGSCRDPDPAGWRQESDHVVRNERISQTPGETITVDAPAERLDPSPSPHWIRITLSERPVPLEPDETWDGSLDEPFLTGETEDHCEPLTPARGGDADLDDDFRATCESCYAALHRWLQNDWFADAVNTMYEGVDQIIDPDSDSSEDSAEALARLQNAQTEYAEAIAEFRSILEKCGFNQEAEAQLLGLLNDLRSWVDVYSQFVNDVATAVESGDEAEVGQLVNDLVATPEYQQMVDSQSLIESIDVYYDALAGSVCPELTIDKRAEPETVQPGEEVTFTIEVSNDGPGDLSWVRISDPLRPVEQVTDVPDDCTISDGIAPRISCDFPDGLAEGGSIVVEIGVLIKSDLPGDSLEFVNQARSRARGHPTVVDQATVTVKAETGSSSSCEACRAQLEAVKEQFSAAEETLFKARDHAMNGNIREARNAFESARDEFQHLRVEMEKLSEACNGLGSEDLQEQIEEMKQATDSYLNALDDMVQLANDAVDALESGNSKKANDLIDQLLDVYAESGNIPHIIINKLDLLPGILDRVCP